MEFQRKTKKLSGLPIAFYVVALLFFVLLFSFNSLYYKASEQTKPVIVETPKPIEEPKADSIVKPEIYVSDVEVLPPDTVALAKETPAVKEEKKEKPADGKLKLSDLKEMTVENFLKLDDKKLDDLLKDSRFPARYSAQVVKKDIKTGKYKPQAIAEYFGADANSDLFNTKIKSNNSFSINNFREICRARRVNFIGKANL